MVKVLVTGAVNGNQRILCSRLESLNSSKLGPFDICFCAGNYDEHNLLDEEVKISYPLETYTFGKLKESTENLTQLPSFGFAKVKELTIAFYNRDDIEHIEELIELVEKQSLEVPLDILFTKRRPMGINSSVEGHGEAKLAFYLKPRYHFAADSGNFLQRAPYRNHETTDDPSSEASHFTRFIGLSPVTDVKGDKKLKWLHALDLDPLPLNYSRVMTKDCTSNPFLSLFSSKAEPNAVSSSASIAEKTQNLSNKVVQKLLQEHQQEQQRSKSQFFSGAPEPSNGRISNRKRRKVEAREECWFCLSSPTCDRSLVLSIGSKVYLSVPKGMINAHHVQMIPIHHSPSTLSQEAEGSETLVEELDLFKEALQKFFSSKLGCTAIVLERKVDLDKAKQQHCFVEMIPVPLDISSDKSKLFIRNVVNTEASSDNLNFIDIRSFLIKHHKMPKQEAASKEVSGFRLLKVFIEYIAEVVGVDDKLEVDYVFLEIPGVLEPSVHLVNVDLPTRRLSKTEFSAKIPLQLGRKIACRVLNCVEKVDWRNCLLPPQQEQQLVERYKSDFKEFEPDHGDSDSSDSDN